MLNTILLIITIIGGIIGIATTIFLVGKFVGTLTAAINKAVEIFEIRLTSVTEDIRELKASNEKLTDALNELTTTQIVEMKENIASVFEKAKSAHERISELKCTIENKLGGQ